MVADIDFGDLEERFACVLDEDYSNVLVIDNLPRIDAAKEDKLLAVLRKNVFAPASATLKPGGTYFPRDPADSQSLGYAFFEFASADQADAVYRAAHNYRLDKSHVLFAIRFGDFERLDENAADDDTYKEPAVEPHVEREYLKGWLGDAAARDQFVFMSNTVTNVCWGPRTGRPMEVAYTRANWTDSFVQWTPRGSYLATVHKLGVMLWGGASWTRLGRFPQSGVEMIAFSPCERFLVSWSAHDAARPHEHNLLVWDVDAGVLVRGFVVDSAREGVRESWPLLRFSSDDKYMARVHGENTLSIYETGDFSLVSKKSQSVEGIVEVVWAPNEPVLVYWTRGTLDTPARVAVFSVDTWSIVRTKNLFNVTRCAVYWQTESDFVAVQVDRHAKNRKTVSSNLELFRMREKNIPVDVIESRELLTAVAWEPHGERFVTAHTVEHKNIVSLYTMRGPDSQIQLLRAFERKQLTRLLWSPRGEHLVMASLETTGAFVEFWSMNEMTMLASKEHFLATDIEWDSTGRYAMVWVNTRKHALENSYAVYDFKGDVLFKQNVSRLHSLAWRPRPPSLLTKSQQREIKKNIKSYQEKFERMDEAAGTRETSGMKESRAKLVSVWNAFRQSTKKEWCMRAEKRNQILESTLSASDRVEDRVLAEEWIEEVIEETEQVV